MVTSYRLYYLGKGGQLRSGADFSAASDQAAIREAVRLCAGRPGELWSGGRRLGEISQLGAFTGHPEN